MTTKRGFEAHGVFACLSVIFLAWVPVSLFVIGVLLVAHR